MRQASRARQIKQTKTAKNELPIYSTLSAAGEITSLASLCAALQTIEAEWPQIVGARLSRRSAPASYENGVLLVVVDCQAAMQDMNFKKASLARIIRERSLLRVDEIRVEVGRPAKIAQKITGGGRSAAPVRRTRQIDDATVAAIALEISAEHPQIDPELAEILARCRVMSAVK